MPPTRRRWPRSSPEPSASTEIHSVNAGTDRRRVAARRRAARSLDGAARRSTPRRAAHARSSLVKELARMITTVLAFLLTLGVLIVVHEYGHYRVARGLRRQGAALLGRLRPRAVAPPAAARQHRVRASARCRSAATCACSTSAKAPVAPRRARTGLQPQAARGSARPSSPPARRPTCCWRSLLYAGAHWIGVDEPKARARRRRSAGSLAERAGLRAGDWVRAVSTRRRRVAATCAR